MPDTKYKLRLHLHGIPENCSEELLPVVGPGRFSERSRCNNPLERLMYFKFLIMVAVNMSIKL